ncbi:MAG: peptide-methionine (S)-S-oxide reductase [Pseudomonadota bacterium]|jgi:peptide-methionine (S)-S-oxide reductase
MLRIALAFCLLIPATAYAKTEKAILAGGCFWCVESDLESVKGVKSVVSGYTGGASQNPTYEDHEGHTEAVEVTFDNSVISYQTLLEKFVRSIDVTDAGGQFCDRGNAYKSAIYPLNADQKATAKTVIAEAEALLGANIVTPVISASTFWVAEDYHQDYYKGTNFVLTRAGPKKQSNAYKFYRQSCGRDARVKEVWGANAFSH